MIFVGDGPARADLQAANPDVIFAGLLRGDELSRHYASADLFLFSSLSETFGNVTLEAMASGLATVAFDYGATREHLRDGQHGAAISPGDDEGFIRAAARIGAQAALFRVGEAARSAVQHLHPTEVARDFADLLGKLSRRSEAA